MKTSDRVVVVPFWCDHCGQKMEIDCLREHAPGQMVFYPVDCPHCKRLNNPSLPGPIVDVWRPGERELGEAG